MEEEKSAEPSNEPSHHSTSDSSENDINSPKDKSEEILVEVLEVPQELVNDDPINAIIPGIDININNIIEQIPNSDSVQSFHVDQEGWEHDCEICLEKVPFKDTLQLSCMHRYCKDCLKKYVRSRIDNGWVQMIPCPNSHCGEAFTEEDTEAANKEDYGKYLQFNMLAKLRAEPTCRWCPKAECAAATIGDPRDANFPCLTCEKCATKFCYECEQLWHPNINCKENYKVLKKKGIINKKAEKWKKKHKTRKCLQCRMDIYKDKGCNHMICASCGYQFCWICMKPFTPDHYINGKCAGLQFSSHPIAKRRLKRLGKLLGCIMLLIVIIVIGIPLLLVFLIGILIPILIITIPFYCGYRLVKYIKHRRQNKN